MNFPRRGFLRLGAAAALAVASRPLAAQTWPVHSVRLIVGFAPDGGLGSAARILAGRLSQLWGQEVVVESNSTDDDLSAFAAAATAAPDGHTLLLAAGAPEVSRYLYSKLGFDPATDLVPVSLVATFPDIIIVSNASSLTSVQTLIAYATSHPGTLSWASPGIGTQAHLAGELFKLMAGIKMTHIPYAGISEYLISDLIAGRIDAMFDSAGAALQPVRAHRVRALAVTSVQRFPSLPDLRTVAESGLPGYDVASWYGLYAPGKTPPDIVSKMNGDIATVLRDSAVKEQFEALGLVAADSRPGELAARNAADAAMWKTVIAAAKIKID